MTDPNKDRAERAWRQRMGDIQGLLHRLAEMLSDPADPSGGTHHIDDGTGRLVNAVDVVRRAAHLLNSSEANVRAEERHAWDLYASSGFMVSSTTSAAMLAEYADALLAERRKRFARKEEP